MEGGLKKKWANLRKYGFIIFWWKLRELWLFILMVFSLPLVMIIRLLRKWVIIRFGHLRSERIGHFIGNIELYLSERDCDRTNRRYYDVFYYSDMICNYQLKKMVERLVRVSWFAKIMDKANHLIPGGEIYAIPDLRDRDIEDFVRKTPRHFYFTEEEIIQAQQLLQNLGVPRGAPFVCIFARDSAYLNQALGKTRQDWSYHDYRDADINNYLLAAEEMVRRGYYVIRIGKSMNKPLAIKNPKIIDYSFSPFKNDLLDIYLTAESRFLLGANSGIYAIPRVFRKPMACANLVPLDIGATYYFSPGTIFIPKKSWCCREKRVLTFKEVIQRDVCCFSGVPEYRRAQIEVIENSAQEILDLAIEMEGRLNKVWAESEEDKVLQEKFYSILPWRRYLQGGLIRIGAKFLKENKHLLD